MNFDEAIRSHTTWKVKLSMYLAKPDGSVKAADIEVDHKCDLGKWIHGEGSVHKHLPEFTVLKDEHARFHKAAAAVVRKADSGAKVTEEVMLGANSEFNNASTKVVSAIMSMRRHAAG